MLCMPLFPRLQNLGALSQQKKVTKPNIVAVPGGSEGNNLTIKVIR